MARYKKIVGAKFVSFMPNSPIFSLLGWLITCVGRFNTCFNKDNHANKCCLWREGDRGSQKLRLGKSWQTVKWGEIDGKEVLPLSITKLVEKWNEDTLLRIRNLQLKKEFRVFSARQLEVSWRLEDTWTVKFDIQIVQGSILNTCSKSRVRYSAYTWSWPAKLGVFLLRLIMLNWLKKT